MQMHQILTTHTGSLPRPEHLTVMLLARDKGEDVPELESAVTDAVAEVVRLQRAAGVTIVNDGEMGKVSYMTYVKERLTGFEVERFVPGRRPDSTEFPDFEEPPSGLATLARSVCTGEIRLVDSQAVHKDIANLLAAVGHPANVFMTAASPGVISVFLPNRFYKTREAYLAAIADAMRHEYKAITDAGIILQVDCPDLAMSRHMQFADLSTDEFRREAELGVEALNHALADIPPDRMRMHICWGNYQGPHTHDVPLAKIIDIVLKARPAGISIEASNPRHAHEHRLFDEVRLPDDKYLIPGVVDTTTSFVEHEELVAERLENYARRLGPDRVVAGTDCGFATSAAMKLVPPSITWAKFRSMTEGARIATERLSTVAA